MFIDYERYTHFHWLIYNLKRSRQRSSECVLNGFALDPFTTDKNKHGGGIKGLI